MAGMPSNAKAPEIIVRRGKPVAVILDIQRYREILERLEDLDDLKALRALRRRPLKFRPLDEFLKERNARVSSRP